MPPPNPAAVWYVLIRGKEVGPLSRVELGVEAATGSITGANEVWKEGMQDWVPAGDVPDLASLFVRRKAFPPARPGARPPPPPRKKEEKGAGMSEFDTSHFRLAELQNEESAASASRQMEFDTGHFRLAEMAAEDNGQSRNLEFDTAHFRLAEMGQQPTPVGGPMRMRIAPGAPSPKAGAPTPVSTDVLPTGARPALPRRPALGKSAPPRAKPAAAPKAAPPQPAEPDEDFDPNRTSVDFRTLGAQVHQQQVAQELFEEELVPAEADLPQDEAARIAAEKAKAAELARWAAEELKHKQAAEAKPAPAAKAHPPVPLHVPRRQETGTPIWMYGTVAGVAAVILLVLYLVLD